MKIAWLALLATLLIFVFLDPAALVSDFIISAKSNPDTMNLPYFIFRTLLRMTAAYILVSMFALPYGIITGLNIHHFVRTNQMTGLGS